MLLNRVANCIVNSLTCLLVNQQHTSRPSPLGEGKGVRLFFIALFYNLRIDRTLHGSAFPQDGAGVRVAVRGPFDRLLR